MAKAQIRLMSQPEPGDVTAFGEVDVWVFDLDNTLYPSKCNLFAQVDARMGAFISRELNLPSEHAKYLQKQYYYKYGTTLAGLMTLHGVKPEAFLDYVHDIDLSNVPELPELRGAISELPGRKLIFTNGSRVHAERVATRLGVLELFEDVCSIESCNYVPKPKPEAFLHLVRAHNIEPKKAAMFEDLPHNLVPAHEIGMTTVLVHSDYLDHPAQKQMASWRALPEHIHFATDDLTNFLLSGCVGAKLVCATLS